MNIVLIKGSECIDNRVILNDYRAKHIVKVLKSEPGDQIRVGRVNGLMGKGKIISVKKKYPFHVEMETCFNEQPPTKSGVDLVLALPRPIMLRRILSQSATIGINKIFVIQANRVEKSFWSANLLKNDEYFEHLLTGLEQGVDTLMPEVSFHRRFKVFMEDSLSEIIGDYDEKIFAHPSSGNTLGDILTSAHKSVLIAIGPEGGWVDYEIEKFIEAGFSGFTLGRRILKVDTAVVNIHGRIMEYLS